LVFLFRFGQEQRSGVCYNPAPDLHRKILPKETSMGEFFFSVLIILFFLLLMTVSVVQAAGGAV
jgi:hypothetical protein